MQVVKPDATMAEIEELISEGGDKNIFTQQVRPNPKTLHPKLNTLHPEP